MKRPARELEEPVALADAGSEAAMDDLLDRVEHSPASAAPGAAATGSRTARAASRAVVEEVGRVVSTDGARIVVRAGSSEHEAKRAASCLIAPLAGDLVLVAITPNGVAYVLAILEREAGAPATMALDGDLELRLPKGRFVVAAQEGVDLVSGKQVAITAGRLDVNAQEGSVVMRRLSFLGDLVRAEVDKVKLLAGTFDSVLDRISQRVKRSYRTVEEIDQVRAESIDYTAKSTMSLHAENALVTAEELVKIDGEQIHLG